MTWQALAGVLITTPLLAGRAVAVRVADGAPALAPAIS